MPKEKKEKLLRTLDKLERITENLSTNGLLKITKMQNFSQDNHEQIEKMNNLSLNELKQIAITRYIKNYKDMSKEDLLIALLKSNQSHRELRMSENNNNIEINETKKLFNELRNNFSREKISNIEEKCNKKITVYNYLKKVNIKIV